ncbi:integrase [Sphingomonas oleivorans]|uniref:Integrase n=1 Tax=Sphingomonas oleivorans TaxID=1735121 RepID=A0A2T5FY68_9SPHN|nr:site-specific integrase [Sphingomonas oleivorans]PTQ11434.1 integrase [Sphingomonas oleivorans]
MATGKVIKRTVDALRAAGVEGFLWDEDLKGFGVRTLASGAATYVLQYRMGGREAKTRRYTIGSHGSPWTPVTARAEAERLQILVAQGVDPADADKQRRREAVDLAFSNYADRFAESCDPRAWGRVVKQALRLHIKPILRDKPLPKITRPDVVAVFDNMPSGQQANRRNVFAVLRRLFKWAISRGDIERSPMEGMETPAAVKARDRWLSDEELRRIWVLTPKTHRCFGPIVRLLILTGQRREEVSSLAWAELNRGERVWRLPSERAKNGEFNIVPLNDLAIAVLDEIAGGAKWPRRGRVFATSTGHSFSGYDKGKKMIDALLKKDGGDPVPGWRLHDLRRTVATGLQRLGVRFEVTEAILNHVGVSRSGVAAIYQRHDWKTEKEQAMRDWGTHLQKVLGIEADLAVAAVSDNAEKVA